MSDEYDHKLEAKSDYVSDSSPVGAADIDYLVGPYPEATATYKERSPINAVDQFSVPVALFQGLEDKVVPPNQAEEVSKYHRSSLRTLID